MISGILSKTTWASSIGIYLEYTWYTAVPQLYEYNGANRYNRKVNLTLNLNLVPGSLDYQVPGTEYIFLFLAPASTRQ